MKPVPNNFCRLLVEACGHCYLGCVQLYPFHFDVNTIIINVERHGFSGTSAEASSAGAPIHLHLFTITFFQFWSLDIFKKLRKYFQIENILHAKFD